MLTDGCSGMAALAAAAPTTASCPPAPKVAAPVKHRRQLPSYVLACEACGPKQRDVHFLALAGSHLGGVQDDGRWEGGEQRGQGFSCNGSKSHARMHSLSH